MKMIPIAAPLLGEEEKQAVWEVMDSRQLAQGSRVEAFEHKFAELCGVRHAIATSSGTTALQTAVLALGIGPGDEVITTPFTFIASANVIVLAGARPVFVDIDWRSYNVDAGLIEAAITPRTKAILPVHLFGNPCDMEQIMAIAGRHGLAVIEDACQAHGATVMGRAVGSFGTGCFSFYPTKNVTTAEGGMITTNDDSVADRARLIRSHGQRQRYYHEIIGYNFRMTEIQAAIGLVQLGKLQQFNAARRANAAYLTSHLKGVVTPTEQPGRAHVYHQYSIRVSEGRDELAEHLKQRGVLAPWCTIRCRCTSKWPTSGWAMHDHLPVAEQVSQQILALPVHPALTQADLQTIVEGVNSRWS